jgi:hypothetical protein
MLLNRLSGTMAEAHGNAMLRATQATRAFWRCYQFLKVLGSGAAGKDYCL